MSYKSDIDSDGRGFVYNSSGNNDRAGTSIETALSDPYEAINNRIPFLSPPVDSANRAKLTGEGTFTDTIDIPQYVAGRMQETSVVSAVDIENLIVNGDQTVEIGALLNFAANCILVQSDANSRVKCIVNTAVIGGQDGIGFNVTGASDDSSYELTQGEMRADGAVMFNHTATAPTPTLYTAGVVEFFDTNQILIKYYPAGVSSETVFEVTVCQPDESSVTTGSCVADIGGGIAVIDGDVLSGEFLAKVRPGGTLSFNANAAAGKTIIESGGVAIYRAIGILVGDIELQGAGVLFAGVSVMTGDIDIDTDALMIINSNSVQGDITVNGRLDCIIHNHVGVLTNNGIINGIINGKYYGTWKQKPVLINELAAASISDQTPAGLDIPLQVEFGAGQGSASDPIELKSNGAILIHKANQYIFKFTVQYGRVGAGGASWMFFKLLVDDSQVGNSIFAKLDGTGDDIPMQVVKELNLTAGQVVTIEIVRDSQGNDSGGLFVTTPTLTDWAPAGSATIEVTSQTLIQELNFIAVLPGDPGDTFSTPDSVAASITGDLDIQARISANDWTAFATIMSKWQDTGDDKSYLFQIDAFGALRLFLSEDGAITEGPATSSVITGFLDGTLHWVRVTSDSATGDVEFYTSDDDTDDPSLVNWTALGVTQSLPAAPIYDSIANVEVGGHNTGVDANFDGTVSRASIFNGIGGTLVVDFNPQDYRGNDTFTSLITGEIWTLNGNVEIEV